MSKIISHYENDIDKVWYNSSNILYSECDDKENELKVVRLTFKNGRTYEYKGVKVRDYLMFREAPSQGKAFNVYLKPYENARIENKNMEEIMDELYKLQHPEEKEPFEITLTEEKITIIDNEDTENPKTYSFNLDRETTNTISQILDVLKIKFKKVENGSN